MRREPAEAEATPYRLLAVRPGTPPLVHRVPVPALDHPAANPAAGQQQREDRTAVSASEDTRIGVQAKFPVKKRELNGLNRIAAHLNAHRAERIEIAGYIEFVKHTETIDGDEMTVNLVVVEPARDADGGDSRGHAALVRRIIEESRKGAGKAAVADTLFTPQEAKALDDELDGQIEGIDRGTAAGETNASGEPVAEKSGEEIMAERAEAAKEAVVAATAKVSAEDGKRKEAAAARPDLKAAVTGKPSEVATVDETRGQDASKIVTPGYVAANDAAAANRAEERRAQIKADRAAGATGPGSKTERTPRPARQRPATADPFTPGGGDAA